MKRTVAIGFIWLGCAVAWMILGSTLVARSGEASAQLNAEVQLLWGPPIRQAPPRAFWVDLQPRTKKVTTYGANGQVVQQDVREDEAVEVPILLERSEVAVKLGLQHRQKGLLWFATYGVDFHAVYTFVNDGERERRIDFRFPLETRNAVLEGFAVAGVETAIQNGEAAWSAVLKPGEKRTFTVGYRSRGISEWRYEPTAGTGRVHGFHLTVDTNCGAVDFPAGAIAPTAHGRSPDGSGWHGDWTFSSLVANAPIGVVLPERLNPGPLAARITFFAPVGLLFFFFVVVNFAAVRQVSLHPLNYFFLGAAFFAFHLLFAYLVDHLAVLPAFAIAAQASIGLSVTYARLFVGWRFALRELGLAQLVYLVLFSFSFFLQGFTGLAITIGAVLTLAVMMQVTGRAQRWAALDREAPTDSDSR